MSRNGAATRDARTQGSSEAVSEQPEAAPEQSDITPERPAPSSTLNPPLVTTTIRAPHFAAPAVHAVTTAVREHVPSRSSALFYAGRAGTAVVGRSRGPWRRPSGSGRRWRSATSSADRRRLR